MAFENLQPHRHRILEWRKKGLTLGQVAHRLKTEHGVPTSAGTLSRFLRQAGPDGALQTPTPEQRQTIDTLTLLTEILAEIRGRGDEQRMAIEHLAGQVRILTEVVEESGAGGRSSAAPKPPRGRLWLGLVLGILVGAAATYAALHLSSVVSRSEAAELQVVD